MLAEEALPQRQARIHRLPNRCISFRRDYTEGRGFSEFALRWPGGWQTPRRAVAWQLFSDRFPHVPGPTRLNQRDTPSMTATTLKNYTCKDLAQMAKVQGVTGWHAMRKEELVQALIKRSKQQQRSGSSAVVAAPPQNGNLRKSAIKNPSAGTNPMLDRRPTLSAAKDLSFAGTDAAGRRERDRLVVMVRDPYWLQGFWGLARARVDPAHPA